MSSEQVVRFLAILTLASNVALGVFILFFLISRVGIFKSKWTLLVKEISPKGSFLALIVSLTATSGSLYFSEIAGFEPCKLCWLQRIFMYPLPIVLGVALWKKAKDVWQYMLPLSAIGLVIAAYHYYFQITGNALIPCSAVGFSVSCSQRFFTHFGYITIPWMSFSAFTLITIGMLLTRGYSRKRNSKL